VRSTVLPLPLSRSTAPDRARSAQRPDVATVLGLQRSIGNRRTCALLRKVRAARPTPMTKRRGEFPQITKAHHPGGLSQKEWSDTLKAAKAALDSRDFEQAGKLYKTLYFDLAATAGAVNLRDVASGLPINIAGANDVGFQPGLNLVLGGGASKAGSTGFVDAAGNFGVEFDKAVKAGTPRIAIRLFSGTFKEDKADTLRVLRHEMLHARHREQAIDSLKGGKSLPQTDVDKALVSETKHGGSANTELLAYVEGFMTAFHLTPPPLPPQHALFIDLLGALETTKVDPWRSANEAVRDEALGRLHEYYCNTLDADHRAAFDAWVASLEAQVAKDARATPGSGAAMSAKRNAERMLEHFTAGMREVTKMACAAPARRAA
jgi:hypothetical protein